ncbi:type IV toxin-antitoxin system AbiEi family antitoxin domain-containing protein [Aliiroseovarius sp. CAU 1755]
MNDSRTSLARGRARLTAVIQASGDVVRIEDAVQALDIDRKQAAKLLSRWTSQGWLRRVGSGAYVPVQLDLLDAQQVLQDPWVLVPTLFEPCYIGGRTAAEHWDLTEQIFRDVLVFTARSVASRTVERQGAVFTLKHIKDELIFGTKTVWRGQTRIAVSDVHRTIIDMLDDPSVGGGIQHVSECFDRYLQRPDCSLHLLIDYALRHGNGAIFKRLGFLAERHAKGGQIAREARKHLTKGHAKLDTSLDCPRLITRWRLRVPDSWVKDGRHD